MVVLSGGRTAILGKGTSDVEMERKGVNSLHHFSSVRNVCLILRPDAIVHSWALIEDFWGVKVLW